MTRPRALRVATRGSPLALHQAERFIDVFEAQHGPPRAEVVVIRTTGDRSPDVPIERIGGQGAFVKEVSAAVLDGRADVGVHSAKDLPSAGPSAPRAALSLEPRSGFRSGPAGPQPGLVLAAVPERADPRDAVVGSRLGDLPPGATVATGSVRRRAQLAWLRPDLTFCDLRGNMHRRVERSAEVGAGVLAMAALERLGLAARAAEVLQPGLVVPQVGQGAIAVECREEDDELLGQLEAVDDPAAHAALSAERAFLATLGSGCSLPCGALAVPADGSGDAPGLKRDRAEGDARTGVPAAGSGLLLEGMMASRDGHVLLRRRATGNDPPELGRRLATELLEQAGGLSLADWRDPGAPGTQRP